jgi:hypothetical protein
VRIVYKAEKTLANLLFLLVRYLQHFSKMHFSRSFVGLVSLLLSETLAAPSDLRARDLASFIATERAIALQGALNNIGPNGSAVPGAGAGFVVASPSKANPNCQLPSFPNSYGFELILNRLLHMDERLCSDSKDAYR